MAEHHTGNKQSFKFMVHPIVLIFILTILIRLPVVFIKGDRVLENEFVVLVHNIITGNGYSFFMVDQHGTIVQHIEFNPKYIIPTATIPPVYPLFLTGHYNIFGDTVSVVRWIEIIQVILSGLCCVILYHIVRIKFSKNIAFGTALLFCLYPILVYLPSQISSANLYMFINCLLLYLLVKGEVARETGLFYLGGITYGVLLLARAETIALLPFLLIWILFVVREHGLHRVIAFIVMTLVVIGPWIYRNYRVFNAFVPLTTQGGYNLWQGQNPHATGTRSQYTEPPVHIEEHIEHRILALEPTDRFELELNDIYLEEATSFMKKNPGKVMALALRKFLFYWGYYWGINFTYPGARSSLYWLPWFALLPFFIIGNVLTFKKSKKYFLFYIYFIISTLIITVFFVIPRYRLFILPLTFPFTVSGLSWVGYKFKNMILRSLIVF